MEVAFIICQLSNIPRSCFLFYSYTFSHHRYLHW